MDVSAGPSPVTATARADEVAYVASPTQETRRAASRSFTGEDRMMDVLLS
jgi:hypothetical protein